MKSVFHKYFQIIFAPAEEHRVSEKTSPSPTSQSPFFKELSRKIFDENLKRWYTTALPCEFQSFLLVKTKSNNYTYRDEMV